MSSSGSGPSDRTEHWEEVIANLERAGWRLVPADHVANGIDPDRFDSAVVRSVYGPFGSRTLVDMPTTAAFLLFPDGVISAGPAANVAGALVDLDKIDALDGDLARSSLAAVLMQMAHELDAPGNSATAKASCAAQMLATRQALFGLVKDDGENDALDDLIARLTNTPDGGAKASVSVDAESLLDR